MKKRKKKFWGALISGGLGLIGNLINKSSQEQMQSEILFAQEQARKKQEEIEKNRLEHEYYDKLNQDTNKLTDFKDSLYKLKNGGSIYIKSYKHKINSNDDRNKKNTIAYKCGGKRIVKGKKNMYLS